ncbi:MAG: effector-associated domain EAD1-containing protein [Polyangiaceae bacterium]
MAAIGKWNNARQEKLQDALLEAFPYRAELEQLTYYALDVDLDTLTSEPNMRSTLFGLLKWARSRGKLDVLLEEARRRNPDNPSLRAVAEQRAPFFVPYASDVAFVGRNADIEALDRALKPSDSGVRRVALVGMGGVGKTQLAVEYVHRHRADYPGGVYWVNGAAPLVAEIATITERLGLRDDRAPEAERPGRLLRAFEGHLIDCPQALVIFDNLADPVALREPVAGVMLWDLPCHLLFTTRRRDPDAPFAEIPIGALSEEAALRLLLSSKARRAVLDEGRAEDIRAARAICGALGHLPLAVVLASAFLAKSPSLPLADYLHRLRREGGLSTADAAKIDPLRLSTHHTAVVAATLRAQWDALSTEEARQTLKTAALFADAAEVPRATLAHMTGLSDEAKDGYPAPLEQALNELSEWSLIEDLTNKGLRLHPLVKDFAAKQIDDRRAFAATCAQRLREALQVDRLDAEVRSRGLDAVLSDLRMGELLAGPEDLIVFRQLLRALDREAHCLRRWRPSEEPGFFLQQIRNVSFELGLDEVRAHAEATLLARRLPWMRERIRSSRESDALVRTLAGHTSSVWAVAVMPDGRTALSASHDHSLKLWDISSGCELRTLSGHTAEVNSVAVTPDGGIAISASNDSTLKVWDMETGRELRTLSGHAGEVNGVALTPEGRLAISASSDRTMKIWDIGAGRNVRTLAGHEGSVNAVAITADRRRAVSASDDGTLKIWDLSTGRLLRSLKGHADLVMDVAVTPDDQFVVSGSADGTVKIWDLSSGRELRSLAAHPDWVNGVAVTTDGRFVISASSDHTLKIWELSTGREVHTLKGHAEPVKQVVVTPDDRFAISTSHDQTLKVWELASTRDASIYEGHASEVTSIAVESDGKLALSASQDMTLRLWDLSTGALIRTLTGHSSPVLGVALMPDSAFAVSASEDRTLRIWDLSRGREVRVLSGHTWSVTGVAIHPDGRRVLSVSGDNTLKVWDPKTGRELRTLSGHTLGVTAVEIAHGAELAVSASDDRTLKVWDLAEGREIRTLVGHDAGVRGVAITPDGCAALSASEDGTLRLWDLTTGAEKMTLTGHHSIVTGAAITPDGGFAISTSNDKTLRVWDLADGRCVATLEAHSPLLSCAVAPDGRTFVAGDIAGGIHILDWLSPWSRDIAPRREAGPNSGPGNRTTPRYRSSPATAKRESVVPDKEGLFKSTASVVSSPASVAERHGEDAPANGRIKILFLAASPVSMDQNQLGREAKKIEERLGVGKARERVELVTKWAVRRSELQRFLLEERPHVLHFSGHGAAHAQLYFEDDHGNAAPISKESLAGLMRELSFPPQLIVLNACDSGTLARALVRHVDCCIGMRDPIRDDAAVTFAVSLYQAIALQEPVGRAFQLARSELIAQEMVAAQTPALKTKRGLDAETLVIRTRS